MVGSLGAVAALEPASLLRRRLHAAANGAGPVVPAVEPVAGTDAARRAAELAAKAAAAPPHVLLDPDLASRPAAPARGMPEGQTPIEIADGIVACLLQGTGPILLCVPGTLGSAYETSMLATARAFVRQAGGPVSVASIPYPNGVFDVVKRIARIGLKPADNVLALVVDRLRRFAPQRAITLAGESQGAWLIADTLRTDPVLAGAVTRVAMFAKPGFVRLPASVGGARDGAGLIEWRHSDDVVPSLFHRLGKDVLQGYLDAFKNWRAEGAFHYPPHYYDMHGSEAADWLLRGTRPTADTAHHSKTHAKPAPAA